MQSLLMQHSRIVPSWVVVQTNEPPGHWGIDPLQQKWLLPEQYPGLLAQTPPLEEELEELEEEDEELLEDELEEEVAPEEELEEETKREEEEETSPEELDEHEELEEELEEVQTT